MNLAQACRAAIPALDAEALGHGPRRFSFAELWEYIDRAAAALAAAGLGPGDRIASQQGKAIEETIALLAAAQLGASALPLHPQLTAAGVADLLRRSGARAVILHRARIRGLAAALGAPALAQLWVVGPPLPPGAPFIPGHLAVHHLLDAVKATPPGPPQAKATLEAVYHSEPGLAGAPAEPLAPGPLLARAAALALDLGLGPGHRLLNVLPTSTPPGLEGLLAAWTAGAAVELQRFLGAADVFTAAAQARITHLALSPEQLGHLLAAPSLAARLPDLRVLAVHGPIPQAAAAALAAQLPAARLVLRPAPGLSLDGLAVDPALITAQLLATGALAAACTRAAPAPLAGQRLIAWGVPHDAAATPAQILARLPVDAPAFLRPAALHLGAALPPPP